MPKEYLPGDPSGLIVRKVKAVLREYGVKPRAKEWHMTWAWADRVQRSYNSLNPLIGVKKKRWPSGTEIAAQYMALLLADMRDNYVLKLPCRAAECITPEASVRLGSLGGLQSVRVLALQAQQKAATALPAPPVDAEIVDGEGD